MSLKVQHVLRLGCHVQGYSLTMPKDAQDSGGAPVVVGTEGRQGSAGSNEGGSKDLSSGEAETASEPQIPSMQQQVLSLPLPTLPTAKVGL